MMNCDVHTRVGALAVVALLAGLGGDSAAWAESAEAPTQTPHPAAPPPAVDTADLVGSTDFGRPDFARTLWWHHRRNTARFAISEAQIAAFDRLLALRLAEFERLATANEREQRRYLAAIAAAKWDEAIAAGRARAETLGKLQEAQFAFQVEGMKLLEERQRERLAREIPRLVQTGWIRASALVSGAAAGRPVPVPDADAPEAP